MTWLKEIPAWVYAVLVALLLGIGIGWVLQEWRLGTDVAEAEKALSEYIAKTEEGARQAEAEQRKKEREWSRKFAEIEQDAQEKLRDLTADERAASDALERMRQRAEAATERSRACGNTLTAQLSASTISTAPLSADLLAGLGEAARLYALEADRRGVAGRGCEAAFDSL